MGASKPLVGAFFVACRRFDLHGRAMVFAQFQVERRLFLVFPLHRQPAQRDFGFQVVPRTIQHIIMVPDGRCQYQYA
jgi:hypothetical protein